MKAMSKLIKLTLIALLTVLSCHREPVTPEPYHFSITEVDHFEPYVTPKTLSLQKEALVTATVSPTIVAGGVNDVITITGSNFGTEKGRLRFGNGGYASNYHILEWTDVKIVSVVPRNSYSGPVDIRTYDNSTSLGATNTLTVKYNLDIGVTHHTPVNGNIWERASQVYGEIVWHPKTGTSSTLIAKFQTALDRWKCATGINWRVGSPMDVNLNPPSGSTQTHFAFGNGSSAGAAHEQTFYQQCEDGSLYVSGSNIVFDGAESESVVLHEIGHALGHGHINNSGSCMVPTAGSKISTWDAEGGADVMSWSNNVGVSCQVPISYSDCIILHTYYEDLDGDGYGSNNTVQSETKPSGYSSTGGDCNDSDPNINPSATDIPCNGIDENCNGKDARYKGCKSGDGGGGKPDKPDNPNKPPKNR